MLSNSSLNETLVYQYRRWLELGYSEGVRQRYPRLAGEFCKSLGDRAVDTATAWDVRHFLFRRIKTHYDPKAYEGLVALRNFFDFLNLGEFTTAISIRNGSHQVSPAGSPASCQSRNDLAIDCRCEAWAGACVN